MHGISGYILGIINVDTGTKVIYGGFTGVGPTP
jgi:hypothetical protein